MSELDRCSKQLDDAFTEIGTELEKKNCDYAIVKARLDDCRDAIDLVRMELKTVSASEERAAWRDRIKAYKARIKRVESDILFNARDELLGDHTQNVCIVPDTSSELIAHAQRIQDEDLEALRRSVGVVGDTRQIAEATAIKLAMQTQQLACMKDPLYEIDGALERATFSIRRMLRVTMSSKVVWVLIALILLSVGVVVVLHVVK